MLVTLRYDAPQHQLVLKISDTGMGISPAELPHVFERFFRGDKSRQRENLTYGNGLGLSICRSIVQAHEGTINAESNLGRGATFTVRLNVLSADPETKADSQRVSYTS